MNFGPPYHKIMTLWKRGDENIVIPGKWSTPELEYLSQNTWSWTEKIDGMNIRLYWDGESVTIGGRTDRANLPGPLVAAITRYTDAQKWKEVFGESNDVSVYGEGYGPGIRKGGCYRSDPGLILFDVRVGEWILRPDDVTGIAEALGFPRVPSYPDMTITQAWKKLGNGEITSHFKGAPLEGMVGRPPVELFTRRGERLIVKMKTADWENWNKKQVPEVPQCSACEALGDLRG